jgi:hypothetical protein
MNRMKGQMEEDFNTMFVESIGDGLAVVLGVDSAKALTFMLDPHIAVADPDIYVASVTKLLGTGTDVLFATILDNLRRKTGIPTGDAKSFGEAVADNRRKFQQRSQIKR